MVRGLLVWWRQGKCLIHMQCRCTFCASGLCSSFSFWQSWLKHVCLATKLFGFFSANVQFQAKEQKWLLLQNEKKSMGFFFFHLISVMKNLNTKSSLNLPFSYIIKYMLCYKSITTLSCQIFFLNYFSCNDEYVIFQIAPNLKIAVLLTIITTL